jgi:hypothetical protein
MVMSQLQEKAGPVKRLKSYYRRLYVCALIDAGVNTAPKITAETGMPHRTVQDTISALSEMGVLCMFVGAQRNGGYEIMDWGAINKKWVKANLEYIKKACLSGPVEKVASNIAKQTLSI